MLTRICKTASRIGTALYVVAAGLVLSWPLVAVAELVRLRQ